MSGEPLQLLAAADAVMFAPPGAVDDEAWEALKAELPKAQSPLVHTQVECSWGGTWELLTDEERADIPTMPCPLCGGVGEVRVQILDAPAPAAVVLANDCPACDTLGHLPTRKAVRHLQEMAGGKVHFARECLAASQQSAKEITAVMAGEATRYEIRYQKGPKAGEVYDLALDPKAAREALDDVKAEIAQWAERLDQALWWQEGVEDVNKLVSKARAVRTWLDQVSAYCLERWAEMRQQAAEEPPPAPPPEPRCHCGKVAVADGLCKRHAYEAGLVEHTAELAKAEEAPVCDFCEQRQGKRQYEGNWYCGPCAEGADLPEEAAA